MAARAVEGGTRAQKNTRPVADDGAGANVDVWHAECANQG